jgi:hypothetical protein
MVRDRSPWNPGKPDLSAVERCNYRSPARPQIEDHFSGMLQSFPHHAGKSGRLVPVHDTAFTTEDDDVARTTGL